MKKISINQNWEFTNIDDDKNAYMNRNMTLFTPVDLPHDYTTDCPLDQLNASGHQGGYVRVSSLWYRKYLQFQKKPEQSVFLLFDGVYNNATVYVNGVKVGGRAYGYLPIYIEVSEYLVDGLNLIALHLDGTKEPSSRWFNGQGITRNVWLMVGDQIYIKNDGVFVKPQVQSDGSAKVHIQSNIVSKVIQKNACYTVSIKDASGKLVTEKKGYVDLCVGENALSDVIELRCPKLWSFESPNLYYCTVFITSEDCSIQDCYEVRFGVRTTEFRSNKGFYLNGEHTLFKGVCMHHDGGCVGAAVPKALWKKRILQLKEMGCNAIRTAHNPFDPEFYDLCDELGMMVMDEIFDEWDHAKVPYGYATIWEECHKKDLTDFILRDRNHPCIVLWSIGNEIKLMDPEITKELMQMIRELDDTRKITSGIPNITKGSDDNRALLDVAGYNDGGAGCFIYELDHKKRPDQLMIATEAPHSFQTRGFYRTQTWWRDKNQPRLEIDNLTEEEIFFDQSKYYNSSYDNSGVRTCARDSWGFVEKLPYLCGEFRWTGYDYVGEAFLNAWPAKTHSFGVIDSANFPKDHYYLYQSMWTTKPMLHILPHWTHRTMKEGTKIPVWVYTNIEAVELFLNGKSLGKKERGANKNLEWLVPYEKGTICAKGYHKNQLILEESIVTAGTPKQLLINSEVLPEDDEKALAQISFQIQDENGQFVPDANAITGFYGSCGVKLLGSDNGAIDDMGMFKENCRRAFNGLGMYLIRYSKKTSDFCVIASILGKGYFNESTTITLAIKTVSLTTTDLAQYEIYYTVDGTTPSKNSTKYSEPFLIEETTQIKMSVYRDGVEIIHLQDIFIKGCQEVVVDLTHTNKKLEAPMPVHKISERIIGEWQDGNCIFEFCSDQSVYRKAGIIKDYIGNWWYEDASDSSDCNNQTGHGEIWLSSGDKAIIQINDQNAEQILIDNEHGKLGNTFPQVNQIILKRMKIEE